MLKCRWELEESLATNTQVLMRFGTISHQNWMNWIYWSLIQCKTSEEIYSWKQHWLMLIPMKYSSQWFQSQKVKLLRHSEVQSHTSRDTTLVHCWISLLSEMMMTELQLRSLQKTKIILLNKKSLSLMKILKTSKNGLKGKLLNRSHYRKMRSLQNTRYQSQCAKN